MNSPAGENGTNIIVRGISLLRTLASVGPGMQKGRGFHQFHASSIPKGETRELSNGLSSNPTKVHLERRLFLSRQPVNFAGLLNGLMVLCR